MCPTAVDPEDPRSYYSVSDRLARETPGGWKPDQYANPNNPRSHYETTGPELWEQTDGRDHALRRRRRHRRHDQRHGPLPQGGQSGGRVQRHRRRPGGLGLLAAARAARTSSRASARTSGPTTLRPGRVRRDRRRVRRATPSPMTRRLAREEGLLVGGSCGMAVRGRAARSRPRLEPGRRGRRAAARRRPRLPVEGLQRRVDGRLRLPRRPRPSRTVGDVLRGEVRRHCPRWCTPTRNETVREAIDILREYGVSQMPVVRAEPPVTAGEVVGSVVEKATCSTRCSPGAPSWPIRSSGTCRRALPIIGSGEPVAAADRRARATPTRCSCIDDGKPAGVAHPPGPARLPRRH